jgi:hypothetical protein
MHVVNNDIIFCRAMMINWDAINEESLKLVAASNNKEHQSHLTNNYSPDD